MNANIPLVISLLKMCARHFTTTINTQSFTFIITFVNELGVWKIRNF